MEHQNTDFNKRLIYCLISLIGAIILGELTIKYIDSKMSPLTFFVSHSSEAPRYSQSIAFTISALDNVKSQKEYDTYTEKLQKTVSHVDGRIDVIRQYYKNFPQTKILSDNHFQEKGIYFGTKRESISKFYNTARELASYFQNNTDYKTLHPEDIKAKMDLIKTMAQAEIPNILVERTDMYRDFVERKSRQMLGISFVLIILFTIFIFCIVAIIFYPLHKRTRSLINEINTQKNDFHTEKERLELASKGTSTGIWDWNIQTGKFHWNNVLQNILGIFDKDPDSFNVDFFQSLLHPDDKDGFNLAIKSHIKDYGYFFYQGRLRHSNGHYIWVTFRGEAIRNDDGYAYRMIGSMQDYTTQKEAEIERDLFVQSIESANIAFAIIDLNSSNRNFSYASPPFCELTEYSVERIISSNMSIFSGPDTPMNDLDQIDYALNNEKELCLKMLSYKKDGQSYWNNVTLRPIYINDNFSNYFIVTFQDLTESMQNQKQEIERQRNESLGSLAGSVAHEINNLLMPMTMAEDILEGELKDDCDPFALEQIKMITQYANQAKEIVQGILTFSRKETEDLQKVNLAEELKESVLFIKSLLSNKTTLILNDFENNNIPTLINKTEIKQIITNLCKNAEQSFNNQSGKIEISLSTDKPSKNKKNQLDVIANEFAVITVKDNGEGIKKEYLEKIFEPLFTTKNVGEGTGLGLSVVIGIIRSWGGGIDVQSVLGQGTSFNLYIPIYKDSDDFSDLMDLIEDLESK